MQGIMITDTHNHVLSFDLADILNVLGTTIKDTEWILSSIESVGHTANELHALSDSQLKIPEQRLEELLSGIQQIIDGNFKGYRPGATHPWIIIRAVDSSAYDVLSENSRVLSIVRERFEHVTDLPNVPDRPGTNDSDNNAVRQSTATPEPGDTALSSVAMVETQENATVEE